MKHVSKNNGKKNDSSNTTQVKTSKQKTKDQGKSVKAGSMLGNSSSLKGGKRDK